MKEPLKLMPLDAMGKLLAKVAIVPKKSEVKAEAPEPESPQTPMTRQ